MKFLHSADGQLGKPYGRFDPDVRAALTEARFDVIDTLRRIAAENGLGHVVIAGDVFDTEGPEDRMIVQAISRMSRHAGRSCRATMTSPATAGCRTASASGLGRELLSFRSPRRKKSSREFGSCRHR